MKRRNFIYFSNLAIVLGVTAPSWADEELDEYSVKVSYLYNFCNYVRWPSPSTSNVLTIGVFGPALKYSNLVSTLRELTGQVVANRTIALREFATIESFVPCDIIYVTGADTATTSLLTQIVKLCEKKPVLIVGEIPDGLQRGVTINFVRVGQNIKLEINRLAASNSNLAINAKLQRLAINSEPR